MWCQLIGRDEVTGWRWVRDGLIKTENILGTRSSLARKSPAFGLVFVLASSRVLSRCRRRSKSDFLGIHGTMPGNTVCVFFTD